MIFLSAPPNRTGVTGCAQACPGFYMGAGDPDSASTLTTESSPSPNWLNSRIDNTEGQRLKDQDSRALCPLQGHLPPLKFSFPSSLDVRLRGKRLLEVAFI